MQYPHIFDQVALAIARYPGVVDQEIRPLDLPAGFPAQDRTRISTDWPCALLDLEAFMSQPIDFNVCDIDIVMDYQDSSHVMRSFPLAPPDRSFRARGRSLDPMRLMPGIRCNQGRTSPNTGRWGRESRIYGCKESG
jgi:hypothetical protein